MWQFLTKLAPVLLASSNTARWPPQTAQDLIENFKSVYKTLELPGPIHRQVTDTLRFSYVSPPVNGTSTWRNQESITDEKLLPDPQKNVALYIPGLDGYGLSAFQHQFDDLASAFQLWRLTIQSDDRSSFIELFKAVADFVQEFENNDKMNNDNGVILIGESCGGLVAAAAALLFLRGEKYSSDILKGVVLVNPATSFDKTIWDRVIPVLSSAKYLDAGELRADGLTPYSVIGSLLLSAIIPDGDQLRRILGTIVNLPDVDVPLSSLDQLQDLTQATIEAFRETEFRLPPEVLEHRAGWLTSGASIVNARLGDLEVPTLIITGEEDKLLPSSKEADRLEEALPQSEKLSVPRRGHFVLDQNINLTEAILYSNIDPLGWKKTKKKYDAVNDWNPPPPHEQNEAIEKTVKPFRTALSPVFFSTDSFGKRWKDLGKLPRPQEPLVIVGNHQFAGLDLRMLVAELVEQKQIFPRALAHPITFVFSKNLPGELGGRAPGLLDSLNPINGDFQKFGAVEVSPRNYYRLLQTGQDALLFPGGAKEALAAREDYPLFWPEKVDFVRTAARFNATILPVAAVGMLECVNILVEPDRLAKIPFIRDRFPQQNLSAARYDMSPEDEVIGFPLALPKLPARNYFLFGKPISLRDVDPMDKEACRKVYNEAQAEVRRGLEDLLRAREHDPFKDPLRRLTYERFFGKVAPTFPLEKLN